MLQNSFVIQLIVGLSTLAVFYFGLHFWEKAEDERKEQYRLLAIILFIVTAVGIGYFFYNLITTTPLSFGNGVVACIKALIFIIIGIEIFLYYIDELDEPDMQGCFLGIGSIITIAIIIFSFLIYWEVQSSNYKENIIEVNETRYEKEQYELVSNFDEKQVYTTNPDYYKIVTPYFRCYYDSEFEMYDFFYKSDGEIIYKEVFAGYLLLVPIKDGEKPYYLINNYITYSLDNNNDPPTECNISKSRSYELHLPEEYIKKVQEHQKQE